MLCYVPAQLRREAWNDKWDTDDEREWMKDESLKYSKRDFRFIPSIQQALLTATEAKKLFWRKNLMQNFSNIWMA